MTSMNVVWSDWRNARCRSGSQENPQSRRKSKAEEVDEREATAQYQVAPVDTKWVDTDEAVEGEPTQFRSRLVAKEFESDYQPDLCAGLLHWRR